MKFLKKPVATQLEALGYAVSLEARGFVAEASELRRLHEENEALRQALAQPEQEPVAAVVSWDKSMITQLAEYVAPATLLYTAPPKRAWAGLTYDEVYEFVCTTDSYINLAKAIEAKLKEKNT